MNTKSGQLITPLPLMLVLTPAGTGLANGQGDQAMDVVFPATRFDLSHWKITLTLGDAERSGDSG